jgi:hypothetical protein
VLIGTDGYTWRHEFDGTYAQSSGDVRVVLKQRIPLSKTLALGVEYGVQLPMARVPIGTGKPDYGAVGIASYDWNDVRIDTNVGAAWLGAVRAISPLVFVVCRRALLSGMSTCSPTSTKQSSLEATRESGQRRATKACPSASSRRSPNQATARRIGPSGTPQILLPKQ